MGGAALRRLLELGATAYVFDASHEASQRAEMLGAEVFDGPAEVRDAADVLLLSLPSDEALLSVSKVLFSSRGRAISVLDLSTVSVSVSTRVRSAAQSSGAEYLDCPVIGGTSNAGSWTILVGAAEVASNARRALEALGRVELLGRFGDGLRLKLINNMLLAQQTAGICEAIALARASGIDAARMQATLGAAGSIALGRLFLEVLPAALEGQTANAFSTGLLLKDARSALGLADTMGTDLPVTRSAVEELERLASKDGREDFTALFVRLAADQ